MWDVTLLEVAEDDVQEWSYFVQLVEVFVGEWPALAPIAHG